MNRFFSTFAIVLVSMALGAAIVAGVTWALDDDDGRTVSVVDNGDEPAGGTGANDVDVAASDFTELYDRVRPSVVRITTGQSTGNPFQDFRQGLGSGIVLDRDGRILTNHHVVRGFDSVTVTFSDGTVAEAEVVGKDPGNDVALIVADVDPDVLVPAKLGDSSSVQVGSFVAAIGNPFGLDGTFTTGVVSGLERALPSSADGKPIRGLIQTDAAVNPGNSGGALINMKGEIIGINTAIENPGGNSFAGIAYAVPINTPKRFMPQLVAGRSIEHPRLGISGRTLSASEAEDLGVSHGVAVMTVEPGSAADRAGLKSAAGGEGDVIIAIDDEETKTFEELANYIDSRDVGDEVTITVHRDGEEMELTATLTAWDSTA